MTTHSPHGLGRLITGSVAEAVVQHAHCPVLLWHPEDRAPGVGSSEPGEQLPHR